MEHWIYRCNIFDFSTRYRWLGSFVFFPFTSRRTHWTGDWLGATSGLNAVKCTKKFCPCWEWNSVVKPLARRYTDRTIYNLHGRHMKYIWNTHSLHNGSKHLILWANVSLNELFLYLLIGLTLTLCEVILSLDDPDKLSYRHLQLVRLESEEYHRMWKIWNDLNDHNSVSSFRSVYSWEVVR
jgi:hypothetical protein